MNLKIIILAIHLFVSIGYLSAQEKSQKGMVIGLSLGPSLANLMNSKAPNKIFAFNSLLPSPDVENVAEYTDYEVGLLKDLLLGIAAGVTIEYFIKKDLSLLSGLSYESKGINLNYSNSRQGTVHFTGSSSSGEINETFKKKIRNSYLIFPILIRTYILKHRALYLEGGLYSGYLLSSKVTLSDSKIVDEAPRAFFFSKFDNNSFTHNLDYGFSLGGGFAKDINQKVIFSISTRVNIGLRKVDAKFDNQFEIGSTPLGSQLVTSTNYFGFNSDARNINFTFSIGAGYKIN